MCVIGVGPSGLVAAWELRKGGIDIMVLEQNHDIGGQWLYEPNIEKEHPLGKERVVNVHRSEYALLRLATPRETMGLTDFPFVVKEGREMWRHPGQREVFLYLQDFCERFQLRDIIRFNTRVESVKMLDYPVPVGDLKWVVKSKVAEKVVEEVYDVVVVAIGYYSHPQLPKIKGMDSWKRRQMHCHIYRLAESFKNEVKYIQPNFMLCYYIRNDP